MIRRLQEVGRQREESHDEEEMENDPTKQDWWRNWMEVPPRGPSEVSQITKPDDDNPPATAEEWTRSWV